MKKLLFVPLFALFLGFSSCDIVNNIIPDVEKTITETYNVTIDTSVPSGETESVFIDIMEIPEYEQFSKNIQGYEVDSITYEIINYNAPEDLYFEGSVIAFDSAASTVVDIAKIDPVSLFAVSESGEEWSAYEMNDGFDQVLEWLEDPGSFNLKFAYLFQTETGEDYVFAPEEAESTFTIKVHFNLTVLTGI